MGGFFTYMQVWLKSVIQDDLQIIVDYPETYGLEF